MIYLPFDCESTGLLHTQPHLVSLAALQIDTNWRGTGQEFIRQSMSSVVAAEAWESDPGALAVHGLTEEYTREVGRKEKDVLDEFLALWAGTAHLVAHNARFDHGVISLAIQRYHPHNEKLISLWANTSMTCTMESSKQIVGAQTKPNARTGKTALKNPRLDEAYQHFYPGEDLITNRHSASADTVACWHVFKALQTYGA
jgi:DNA polymerase III epsilon subunit-like protein